MNSCACSPLREIPAIADQPVPRTAPRPPAVSVQRVDMRSVQSPPGRRELPFARGLLLPAILMAGATGAAVALVTEPARIAVGVCGAVATALVIASAAEAARRGR